jgi:endonuclease G
MTPGYLDELRRRAAQAFPEGDVARGLDRYKAVIGPTLDEGTDAATALELLRELKWPSAKQIEALEKVIRMMRPVVFIRKGIADPLHVDIRLTFPGWDTFRELLKPLAWSIGAVMRFDEQRKTLIGTGFIVAPRLLMTNRHVVDMLTHGSGVVDEQRAIVNFEREFGILPKLEPVPIARVVAIHEQHDLALLELAGAEAAPPVTFAEDTTTGGAGIAVVGYPVNDVERNPLFVNALFDGAFGVKRAAPGDVLTANEHSVFHDCTTLGGNSGSPVFSIATGRVIGVHREGLFLTRNEAVPAGIARAFAQEHAVA